MYLQKIDIGNVSLTGFSMSSAGMWTLGKFFGKIVSMYHEDMADGGSWLVTRLAAMK